MHGRRSRHCQSRFWILLPILAMVLIQWVSGVPNPAYLVKHASDPMQVLVSQAVFAPGPRVNNLLHIPVFAALACLWCWSMGAWVASWRRGLVLAAVFSLSFAAFNEFSQLAVPTRYATWDDMLLNFIGVTVGLLLCSFLFRSRNDSVS